MSVEYRATISSSYGNRDITAESPYALKIKLADYCRGCWHELDNAKACTAPAQAAVCVKMYFDKHPTEKLEYSFVDNNVVTNDMRALVRTAVVILRDTGSSASESVANNLSNSFGLDLTDDDDT